jgi:uncharacterized protein YyaL (SSP411 family)
MTDIDSAISRADHWFLTSGAQDTDEGSGTYGCFNAWYDLEGKHYSYGYSEITGYAMTALANYPSITSDPVLLKKAGIALDWLNGKMRDTTHGGYHCRVKDGSIHPWLCSFDNAMILNGLTNMYRATKDNSFLEEAIETGDWLLNFMKYGNGSFRAKFDVNGGKYIESDERWSTQSGSFLVKNVIGLLNLSDLSGDPKYEEYARGVCDHALSLQQKNGRFVTNPRVNDTYLHPHCYSIEGLLTAGIVLDDERYIHSCRKGADWLKTVYYGCGHMAREFTQGAFSTDISSDSTSQSLRIWTLLSRLCDYEFPEEISENIVHWILGMQSEDPDPNAFGGFYYGVTNNKVLEHVSIHGTMFIRQTLDLLQQKDAERWNFNLYSLI